MKDIVLLSLPDWVDSQPKMYFPLALTYLAAVVSNAGYSVEILDCRDGVKDLPEARFYGFSCATPQIMVAKQLAKQVNGQTIIGGAHASLLPNDCVKHFDYVVRGEGEEVILDILSGHVPKGIITAPRIKNLDTVPYPAWDMVDQPFSDTLFPGERYGTGDLAATIIGSRGCPYACSFCGNINRVPVVYRSVDNILGELKELISRNVRHFRFEDDCFTIHPQFDKICQEITRLNVHYKCHTRSDLLTPEKAGLMKDSGCEECGLGVESADDRVLALVNKKETAQEHLKAVRTLKEAGIRAKTYFVTGLPGETDKTIDLNKDFVKEAQIDKWTVSTFTPYPGCPVFHRPGAYGVEIINFDWSRWWNYCESGYNHILIGQRPEQMWARYQYFYRWLRQEGWKNEASDRQDHAG